MSARQAFRVQRIDAAGDDSADRNRPLVVQAATFELAADRVMRACEDVGYFDNHPLPVDFILRGDDGAAKRFRCERVVTELQACEICGCSEDRACKPPCSWVDDNLCSTPACVAAAEARARG